MIADEHAATTHELLGISAIESQDLPVGGHLGGPDPEDTGLLPAVAEGHDRRLLGGAVVEPHVWVSLTRVFKAKERQETAISGDVGTAGLQILGNRDRE